MTKVFISLLVFCVFIFATAKPQELKHCGTTEVYREIISKHPELLRDQSRLEDFTKNFTEDHHGSPAKKSSVVLVIPVVFHIVHNYGAENISDAQVYDQMRILNEDFRLLNSDTSSIVPAFKSIAADCEIEFRLATVDPNGNCTNGIDRIASLLTYNAYDNAKLNPWPDNMYLNIWTASSLALSGAAAYAYYPGTAPPGADGIISIHSYIGSIGTGTPGRSRVLTHEVGHYLNLMHVWGNTNDPGVSCGDDFVFDTPVTLGWTTCNINGTTCGNVIDNVQNYMEYAYCNRMFTEGQKIRMLAALNSPIGDRDNLWTSANLTATGANVFPQPVCAPVADFIYSSHTLCEGDSIAFQDVSWNGHPTSWSWTFSGGTPAASPDSTPVIQYTTAGTYSVSMTVSNPTGSDSITKNGLIRVGGAAVNSIPYSESFETVSSFPGTDGYVENPDGGNTWQRVTGAASTGTASIRINNFSGNAINEPDAFVTGAFNLMGMISPILTFKVAYAQRDTLHKDKLNVYGSYNCGQLWILRYGKYGTSLNTAGIVTSSFVPAAADWRKETVVIAPLRNHDNVRFKFENVSATGNNLYIDDINITDISTGIDELQGLSNQMQVYPNPATGKFSVSIFLVKKETIQLSLNDVAGRVVKSVFSGVCQQGIREFTLDENLSPGIYFIRLVESGGVTTELVVIIR